MKSFNVYAVTAAVVVTLSSVQVDAVSAASPRLDDGVLRVFEEGYFPARRTFTPLCTGTGSDGPRIHFVVAVRGSSVPADVLSRSKEMFMRMDDLLADAAWRQGGEVKRVRLATNTGTPGCSPTVHVYQMPQGISAQAFRENGPVLLKKDPLISKLATGTDSKILVLYRATAEELPLLSSCGNASIPTDEYPAGSGWSDSPFLPVASYAFVYCMNGDAVLHELFHTMGAVDELVPAAGGWDKGHCVKSGDLMCYGDGIGTFSKDECGTTRFSIRVDCTASVYFNLKGPILRKNGELGLNVADSPFLQTVAPAASPGPAIGVAYSRISGKGNRTVVVQVSLPRRMQATVSFEGGRCYSEKKISGKGIFQISFSSSCVKVYQGGAKVRLQTSDYDNYWTPIKSS